MNTEVKTIETEAREREALHHMQWLATTIRNRRRISRKRLYRMRPEDMTLLEFESALRKLRDEGKITGTNILGWAAD